MATKVQTSLQLGQNQLLGLVLENLASAPSSPAAGRVYWDTALVQLGVYTGSAWIYIPTGFGLTYKGTWNASTNSPALVSSTGTAGFYYVVATAGSTTLDSFSTWKVGDWVIFNGSVWERIDNTEGSAGVTKFAANVGALTGGTPLAIEHGLGTADCTWKTIEISSGDEVLMDAEIDSTSITLTTNASFAANTFRVVVEG